MSAQTSHHQALSTCPWIAMLGVSETGEPIGLARLLLRPTATLSVEAKERQEQRERHMQSS